MENNIEEYNRWKNNIQKDFDNWHFNTYGMSQKRRFGLMNLSSYLFLAVGILSFSLACPTIKSLIYLSITSFVIIVVGLLQHLYYYYFTK